MLFLQLIEYNVPGGKLNRGLSVVHALQSIKGPAITHAEAHEAAVVGWCIEWLQAFFLVADDVMDK
jgi:farnesyl diphosphate synthase